MSQLLAQQLCAEFRFVYASKFSCLQTPVGSELPECERMTATASYGQYLELVNTEIAVTEYPDRHYS